MNEKIGGKAKKVNLGNFGFHVSRGKDIVDRIEAYNKAGFRNFQIFVNSPRQMLNKPSGKTFEALDKLGKYVKENKLNLFIHAPYTINLSNKYRAAAYWNVALRQELEMAERIGAKGVVVHTGRYKEQDRDTAIGNMVANIACCIQLAKSNVPLLIETPAGQGTELGVTLEDMGVIWRLIPTTIRKRLGICVDTCHIFAAGYDIRTKTHVKDWFNKFDRLIGIKHIKLIHLNDSKMPVNSHLDRHARLMHGEISDGLAIMVREFNKLKVPIVVETPGDYWEDFGILERWLS